MLFMILKYPVKPSEGFEVLSDLHGHNVPYRSVIFANVSLFLQNVHHVPRIAMLRCHVIASFKPCVSKHVSVVAKSNILGESFTW